NRRRNDALRNRPHRYESYSKTVFTAAVDSALLADTARLAALDSGSRDAIDFLGKQHLLLIESATRRSFVPPAREKEEVTALRVSGLEDPSLLALAASTKTFSPYAAQIIINERSYLGPLSPNSPERYLFMLEDTLYQGADSVFVIRYQPRSGARFDGLKGVLWVCTDGYALQQVIAEPAQRAGGTGVKLQQRYARVGGTWFPVEMNTYLYLDFIEAGPFKAMGITRTYLRAIAVDLPMERKELRGPELVMDRLAARRDEAYWAAVRTDTLAPMERRTYAAIDSLSKAEGLERKLKWAERLAAGRLPIGPIDLRLDELLRYNAYEGFRAGVGAATNDRLWRHASLGGYAAYGFGDRAWKHGGDLAIKPWPGRGPELRLHYAQDVVETGGVAFPGMRAGLLDPEGMRMLFVSRMDRQERVGGELAWRISGPVKLWLGTDRDLRWNLLGYRLAEPVAEGITLLTDRALVGGVTLGLRYAPREQLVRVPGRQFVIPSRWPVLHARLLKGVDGLWQGDRDLWRIDAQVDYRARLRLVGELAVRAMAGWADAHAPYAYLYNLRGTNDPRLPLSAPGTFEALRPNELLADRYAALHLRQGFAHLFARARKWRPVPSVVAAAAWGGLHDAGRHRGLAFAAMRQPYFEAGLQVDGLLRSGFTGFGVGAYHRLGPLMLPAWRENIALKATLSFSL
ncbi:MAG: DUF5686 family protein, partial [Flavobacteriales bacterium]